MINLSLFSQIIQHLPRNTFKSLVNKHQTDRCSKGIDSWTHLVSMIFCHLAKVNSVRDISNGLRAASGNLNHLGVKRAPSKSSISYINSKRNWKLFRDFYFLLLEHLQKQHSFIRPGNLKLKRKIFMVDSTTIPLCLSIFDWAKFRSRKGAIKLHTVLDYDGCLPVFMDLTEGSKHDVTAAREMTFPSGSVLVMDRGYVDFLWLFKLDSSKTFFVTRMKKNILYKVVKEWKIQPDHKGLIKQDAEIILTSSKSFPKYPRKLRIVKVWDELNQQELIFLTNNFSWTATTVSDLYKSRWQIEIFFKQIKQHLKIKTFIGTTKNAVLIQVWTALISMLIAQFLKAKAKFNWHLSNLITFLRLNLLVKIELYKWLNNPFEKPPNKSKGYQLQLRI